MNKRALKRISLSKLFDLKIDYSFKQLFGSERNKHITIVFLNAILQRTGRNTIQEVMFASQISGTDTYLTICQIRVRNGMNSSSRSSFGGGWLLLCI